MAAASCWRGSTRLLLALSIAAGWPQLHAAQIKAQPVAGGAGQVLSITGTIQSGDAERLARTFARVTRISEIRLASRGGDVVEATQMGEIILAMRVPAVVPADETCASACFFLWLNASRRLASDGLGHIGLHRPFLNGPADSAGARKAQTSLVNAVTAYLERKRVPRKFTDLMMSQPSSQFYWLTRADLRELGTVPPDLAEVYLARCGDSSDQLLAKRRAAQRNHDATMVKEISVQMNALVQCQARLDDEARGAAIEKLRAGWRPPPALTPGR